jgi:hypothetical protein
MGAIHKKAKKLNPLSHILDKDTFDALHPMGTQAEAQYDAQKAAEKQLKEMEANPEKDVIPLPDEEDIERLRRRKARRGSSTRANTVFSTDEGFGG